MIFPGDYDSSKQKGVDAHFQRFDEQGFFEKVWFVTPFLRRDRRIVLGEGPHELWEFGLGSGRAVRRLLAPLHLARLITHCARLVRRERIDLIRATEPSLCGVVAWITSRVTGVPYVVSLHADYDKRFELDSVRGAPTLFGSRALVRPIERWTLGGAARVMPIRESLVPYALSHGVRQERVRVIPHGIDLESFTRPPAVDAHLTFAIPAGKAIIAFAGRLSPENYIDDMLTAIRRLGDGRDDFVFVMAGGGALEEAVTRQVGRDPVLRRVVRPVGFVPQEVVRALRFASAASLCLMGGFSLIEACAAGRPVISYDVEWHRELVIDGVTGRLLPEHDTAGVAEALALFLDEPALADRLGDEARRLALARYSLQQTQEIKRQVYGEILGDAVRSPG